MSLSQIVKESFIDSYALKEKVVEDLVPVVTEAGRFLAEAIKNGGKILSCGNGGSSGDAGHFVCELVNRFQIERDPLPAVALVFDTMTMTAIANDYSYDEIFSKQIKALGKKGDVLLVISTSGNSQNILQAIRKAHEIGMCVVVLSGKDGGKAANLLNDDDIEIRVPSEITPRIQEVHLLVIHSLCDLIDRILFADRF